MNIKGLKIALVGSSSMLTTYKSLESALKKEGALVTNLGVGGTSAEQWLRDVVCFPGKDPEGCKQGVPRINVAAELAKVGGKFDLVIGQLGTNDGANASAAKQPNGVNAGAWPPRMLYLMSRFADKGFYIMPSALRGTATDAVGKHYKDANVRPYGLAMKDRIGNAAFDPYPISAKYIATEGDGVHFPSKAKPSKELVAAIVQHVLTHDPVVLTGMPPPSGPAAVHVLKDEPGARAIGVEGEAKSMVPILLVGAATLTFLLLRRGRG